MTRLHVHLSQAQVRTLNESRAIRALTFPSCPSCGSRMERRVSRDNHDRPALTFLRCTGCAAEEGHVIERAAGVSR